MLMMGNKMSNIGKAVVATNHTGSDQSKGTSVAGSFCRGCCVKKAINSSVVGSDAVFQ